MFAINNSLQRRFAVFLEPRYCAIAEPQPRRQVPTVRSSSRGHTSAFMIRGQPASPHNAHSRTTGTGHCSVIISRQLIYFVELPDLRCPRHRCASALVAIAEAWTTADQVMEHSRVEPGTVLAGKYRVERVLGRGGMGIVIQAMHLLLHQPVAVKVLLPEALRDQQVVQRFLREAQAAARLHSEHVARVIDVGMLEDGAPYMVLEYLEGTDLSRIPRSQLTVGGIVDLVLQACEALSEAHSLGIVHRDIKPANLFVTQRVHDSPIVKLLDFGISKISSETNQLTATQVVMGMPAYMSPEQIRSSRDADHRSDIWSLGVVLYELLQGSLPFGNDEFPALVTQTSPTAPTRNQRTAAGKLDAIVYRCLEKEREKRFANVAELAQAIARYSQSEIQADLATADPGVHQIWPASARTPGGDFRSRTSFHHIGIRKRANAAAQARQRLASARHHRDLHRVRRYRVHHRRRHGQQCRAATIGHALESHTEDC